MTTLKLNQRVALEANKNEFKLGVVNSDNNYKNQVLVKFDLGYSRWVNISNLEIVS